MNDEPTTTYQDNSPAIQILNQKGSRHQIESPKRPTKESAQGRLPQSNLPQSITSKYELS
jgi:hypothetical protein